MHFGLGRIYFHAFSLYGCPSKRAVFSTIKDCGTSSNSTDSLSRYIAPVDCHVMGHVCDCPPETWANVITSKENVCKILKGKTIFFAGDSLSRDTWSSAAIWLLADEISSGLSSLVMSLNRHEACMICAWKFLGEILPYLREKGLLTEVLTTQKSVSTFHVCNRNTKLVFKYARLFSDINSIMEELGPPQSNQILVISAGILEMTQVRDDVSQVQQWALQLEKHASEENRTIIFLGAHHRLVDFTPRNFFTEALGWQGNDRIHMWTALVQKNSRAVQIVDPFNLTKILKPFNYLDSEDGLHFGQWINLQRFQLVMAKLKERLEVSTGLIGRLNV